MLTLHAQYTCAQRVKELGESERVRDTLCFGLKKAKCATLSLTQFTQHFIYWGIPYDLSIFFLAQWHNRDKHTTPAATVTRSHALHLELNAEGI